MANLLRESYDPAPQAVVRRYALATRGDHLGTGPQLALTAFGNGEAEKIVAGLRAALPHCARGYTGDGRGTTAVTVLDPIDVGDEAVSFHTSGRGTPTWYTVVRQGQVLVRFASSTASGMDGQVPAPLVVQQIMKLRAATD
ncbi:hypothetical protein [Streptomyces sp. NPDC047928]|uniref:hypothetical protein n=1 Tax=unclassified Streptomyces TaxID=2593676 RepID=UPI0037135204